MIAASIDKTQDYVLEEERDAEGNPAPGATIFHLRTMSADQRAAVEDKLVQGAEDTAGVNVNVRQAAQATEAVRYGIGGWSNMVDEAGNAVEPRFKAKGRTQALHDESLDRLVYVLDELAGAAMRFNKLTEDEAGNSASSPSSPSAATSPTTRSSRSSSDAPNAKAGQDAPAATHVGDATAAAAAT
jgi:hypothetical protein